MEMNITQESQSGAPTYLISDYIEIAYLGIVIVFGIPGNFLVLRKLLIEQKLANKDLVKSGFVMLKINLNITDLFILLYALGKFVWLITYQWIGGDFLCRVYQMFSMFSLYSSSNIVVCIALDRLRNVMSAKKIHIKSKKINTVTVMAICSWTFSFICSLPQFFLFQTIVVAEYDNFVQCTDIWQISRFNKNEVAFAEGSIILSPFFENSYNVVHLVMVFWGPLMVLIITYAVIATKLTKYSLRTPNSVRRPLGQTIELSVRGNIAYTFVATSCMQDEPSTLDIRFQKKDYGNSILSPRMPTWRKQLRSKVFRTTILVILIHFLFWFPYNALGLMKYVNQPFFEQLSANANIFKDLQILITLINPFMYGFKTGK
ncbi:unnamed protein product [Caenorhabditis bovis]|uniref:G-protein coupled receptors family 1 profile domain-containing protein n=1 Tax=Caenorhabditis bovis TaxID=2654633 RepID=A0A8S1EQ20_9PELO|nr:unnamed protein product [Caenorhabditis bovis]